MDYKKGFFMKNKSLPSMFVISRVLALASVVALAACAGSGNNDEYATAA